MKSTVQDKRQPLPSILTVYRPIEEYWETHGDSGGIGPDPAEALDPFDAFLVHRVLELVPGLPLLVDTAVAGTRGASSLIGLNHPHVRGVVAVVDRQSVVAERALSTLSTYIRQRGSTLAPLDIVSASEMPGGLAEPGQAVILADARSGDGAGLAADVGRWLDELPGVLVLVLGLGRVGSCRATESLVGLCAPETGKRFWLARELGEMLAASHLGVVARDDHPHVADVLTRLQQYYTGNYGFLDLFQQVNLAALREARIDAEVMRNHPLSWALTAEIDELKQSAREAKEQAAAATQALAVCQRELAVSRAELGHLWRAFEDAKERSRMANPSVLVRLRRKLAATPLGKAWRLARPVRHKLAPTPLGKSWRLAKRIARKCLSGSH